MLKFKHKIRQGIEILPTKPYDGAIIPFGTIIPFENISYVIIEEELGKFSIMTKQNRDLSFSMEYYETFRKNYMEWLNNK